MEGEETPFLVYVPEARSILISRAQAFRPYSDEKLPGVTSILDGLARQSEL